MEQEPLLFIQGPPVFINPNPTKIELLDESTSVYTKPNMARDVTHLVEQLRFLNSPFQRHVYRPLKFNMSSGEVLQGVVDSLDDEKVMIRLDSETEDSTIIEVEILDLESIYWRDKEFKIKRSK